MIKKSLLIVLIFTIIFQFVQSNDFGIRILVSPSGLNKCKNYGFTKFLPDNKLTFNMKDQNLFLIEMKNLKGDVLISQDDVILQGRQNTFVINVQDAQTGVNFSYGTQASQKNQRISCSFSFSLLINFTQSDLGQLMVENIVLQQFKLDEKSIVLPGLFKSIQEYFVKLISKEIEKQVQQQIPLLVQEINKQLLSISLDLPIENTHISLDCTYNLPQISENMLVLQTHGYAFNNLKEKQRTHLVNKIEFPEFKTMSKEYIIMISEYTINSFLFAMHDSGDLTSTFDVSYLKDYQSYKALKFFLQGFSYRFQQSQKKELLIKTISPPSVEIQDKSIFTRLDCILELKEIYENQKGDSLFNLTASINMNFNVNVLNSNYIYFQIDNISFENIQLIGSSTPDAFLQSLVSGLLYATKGSLDSMLKKQLIPINNNFFSISQPNVYLHQQHIIIEGNIDFNINKLETE